MNLFSSLLRAASPKKSAKILCYINHYFGPSNFVGKSTSGCSEKRSEVVYAAFSRIKAMPFQMDIRICGFKDSSLLPIDLDVSYIGDPRKIVYASIERMFEETNEYDYFLNIEDDILIRSGTLTTMMSFADSFELNEIYLPNRMEFKGDGTSYCVDLLALPGWQGSRRRFQGVDLDIAINPHSAMFFLNREQMRYATDRVNLQRRDVIIGELMASALANVHAHFSLWRAKSDLLAHHVVHLDKWLKSPP
jgi:hypothetical protein